MSGTLISRDYKKVLSCIILMCFGFTIVAQQSSNTIIQRYRAESSKLLEHYLKEKDEEKLKAAHFILDNILIHQSQECVWVDTNGTPLNYNELDYPDFGQADMALQGLKKNKAQHYIKQTYDIEQVTAKDLIQTIDDSFEQWRNNPWSKKYSFETFCEYILPYRNNNEPYTKDWKPKYRQRFGNFKHNVIDLNDPMDVYSAVLNKMKHFEFLQQHDYPQPLLSAEQLLFRERGSCSNLAHAAVLGTRAFGLAVTNDFTPFFAASSSGHFWNTIIDNEGIHIPFNGTDNGVYAGEENKRMGKVLRTTYSTNKNALSMLIPAKDIPYFKLQQSNMIDVTDEYVSTSDINYDFGNPVKNNIGFLLAYNYGEWKALWWGKADTSGKTTFKNMGRNLVYLPAQTSNEATGERELSKLTYEKHPLLLTANGTLKTLEPDLKNTFDCSLSRNNETELKAKDFNTVTLNENESFKLYYWNKGWQFFGTQKVENETLSYKKLPKNALFLLLPEEPDRFERLFIIDERSCEISWF